MIKITIERTTTTKYMEVVQFCVQEVPAEITGEPRYGNAREVQFDRTYEPREVAKTVDVRETLVIQEIENDADFDLKAVIKAINKL